MRKYFFYLAIVGWILSAIVQLLLVVGIDVESQCSFTWLLHIGVFAVWFPAILLLIRDKERSAMMKTYNPIDFWKALFKGTPVWLVIIALGGFIYTWVSGMWYMFSVDGVVDIMDGQYVMQNHGSIIKVLTEQEYHSFHIREQMFFSAFWLAFYGIAMGVLYPFNANQKVNESATE